MKLNVLIAKANFKSEDYISEESVKSCYNNIDLHTILGKKPLLPLLFIESLSKHEEGRKWSANVEQSISTQST